MLLQFISIPNCACASLIKDVKVFRLQTLKIFIFYFIFCFSKNPILIYFFFAFVVTSYMHKTKGFFFFFGLHSLLKQLFFQLFHHYILFLILYLFSILSTYFKNKKFSCDGVGLNNAKKDYCNIISNVYIFEWEEVQSLKETNQYKLY